VLQWNLKPVAAEHGEYGYSGLWEAGIITEFGTLLQTLRIEAGLSQRELARRTDLSHTYISKLEKGLMGPPSDDVLARLAGVLAYDAVKLFWAAGRVPPHLKGKALVFGARDRFGQYDIRERNGDG